MSPLILLPKNLCIICKFAKIDHVKLKPGKSHTSNKIFKLSSFSFLRQRYNLGPRVGKIILYLIILRQMACFLPPG